jgi:phosphoribosylamine--glycine ligase
MKIAIIGSGGREHALAWKLAQSVDPGEIYMIPGNGGTTNNVPIRPDDFDGIRAFCEEKGVGLIVVGPEDPLVKGIVDYFSATGVKIFGPSQRAAALEGSKIAAKKFMKKYGVATADFWLPEEGDDTEEIIDGLEGRCVIKFDGLAAGKGVYVCSMKEEALHDIDEIMEKFGAEYLIEERLSGQELSLIGLTDGRDIRLLLPSQDHKAAYDNDLGPNTGGMGAFCPVPFCDERLMQQIRKEVVEPTLQGIQAEKMNYKGVIYFGLMITNEGPKLLEYNVRFGDPETEVILPALKSDLLSVIMACLNGSLAQVKMEFSPDYFVDVVLASGGYPGNFEKGLDITGLDLFPDSALIFHAGTKLENGRLVTSGGRVLNVVGRGATLAEAIGQVYMHVSKINFKNMHFRRDIAQKGLVR